MTMFHGATALSPRKMQQLLCSRNSTADPGRSRKRFNSTSALKRYADRLRGIFGFSRLSTRTDFGMATTTSASSCKKFLQVKYASPSCDFPVR